MCVHVQLCVYLVTFSRHMIGQKEDIYGGSLKIQPFNLITFIPSRHDTFFRAERFPKEAPFTIKKFHQFCSKDLICDHHSLSFSSGIWELNHYHRRVERDMVKQPPILLISSVGNSVTEQKSRLV